MTLAQDPEPELTTTRTGGGRTAWLITFGTIAVLGLAIYVGVSGPAAHPPGSAAPRPSVVAGRTTVTPSQVPSPTPSPTPDPNQVVAIRADPAAPLRYQYLGTALTLDGHGTLAVLDPVAENQYRGIYRIPFALLSRTAHLEFDAVTASVSHDDLDRIGSWTVPLKSVRSGSERPAILLDTVQPAQDEALANPDFSAIATNGYRLTVTMRYEASAAVMTIDIAINADQTGTSATPAPTR